MHSESESTHDRPTNGGEQKQHARAQDGHSAEDQLDALRSNTEHHGHHARGDVGGKYHDQDQGDGVAQKAGDKSREDVDVKKHAKPILIVVMGVSACGKSTVGAALANALGMPFTDADELHPQSNIDKMSHGIPLTDADRQPWLERVREEAVRTCKQQDADSAYTGRRGIVVGCSSLKLSYRDILRGVPQSPPEPAAANAEAAEAADPAALPTYFVHIRGTRDALLQRMQNRKGHFMKANMLDSQLETLDPPEETGEPNVVTIELETSTEDQVREAKDGLKSLGVEV